MLRPLKFIIKEEGTQTKNEMQTTLQYYTIHTSGNLRCCETYPWNNWKHLSTKANRKTFAWSHEKNKKQKKKKTIDHLLYGCQFLTRKEYIHSHNWGDNYIFWTICWQLHMKSENQRYKRTVNPISICNQSYGYNALRHVFTYWERDQSELHRYNYERKENLSSMKDILISSNIAWEEGGSLS